MRLRITGAILFGLGVLALVLAAGLAFIVAPKAGQLPYDLQNQSIAEAPGATFLQIRNGTASIEENVTLRSTINVQTDAAETAKLEGPLDGTAAVWLVGQEVVRTDTGEVISAYSTSLALDRKTGAAADWSGQWLDTGTRESVDYSGHIYKFPFGTEKKTYEIFDRDILTTQPATFVKTEEIEGLETYQFVQEIRNGTQTMAPETLQLLAGQLLPGATSAEVRYSNTRTVWVEPVTGQFIKVQEDQNKTLVGNNGQEVTLLDALFTYTDDTIAKSADSAEANRSKLQLVKVWGPLGLLVVGLLLVAIGFVLATRSPRTAPAEGVPAQHRGRRRADDDDATVVSDPAGRSDR